jgi:hypothetical protein
VPVSSTSHTTTSTPDLPVREVYFTRPVPGPDPSLESKPTYDLSAAAYPGLTLTLVHNATMLKISWPVDEATGAYSDQQTGTHFVSYVLSSSIHYLRL